MTEDNLLKLFNKLNDSQYVNGIVNLSNCTLNNPEISVLSKGLGFCPSPGAPDIGDIIQDVDVFKRRARLQLFFSESNQDPSGNDTQAGGPLNNSSSNSYHPSIQ